MSDLPASLTLLNKILAPLEVALEDTHTDVDDPNFGDCLDRQILHQLINTLQEVRLRLEADDSNRDAQKDLFKVLGLLERTRGRLSHAQRAAAREAALNARRQQALPQNDDTPISTAIEFLQAELAEGSRPAQALFTTADSLGISKRTLNRAKMQLGIRSALDCTNNDKRHWHWSLPAHTAPALSASAPPLPATPSSTPDSTAAPIAALVPAASAAGAEHKQQTISTNTQNSNPATPMGLIGPITSSPSALSAQNSALPAAVDAPSIST